MNDLEEKVLGKYALWRIIITLDKDNAKDQIGGQYDHWTGCLLCEICGGN
jgi:hypothetical protein